jgi:hypothetical protein
MYPKVFLNKANFIECIELPDGRISKRNYGVLPELSLLDEVIDQEFEIYDASGEKIKHCLLLEVERYKIRYDVI